MTLHTKRAGTAHLAPPIQALNSTAGNRIVRVKKLGTSNLIPIAATTRATLTTPPVSELLRKAGSLPSNHIRFMGIGIRSAPLSNEYTDTLRGIH